MSVLIRILQRFLPEAGWYIYLLGEGEKAPLRIIGPYREPGISNTRTLPFGLTQKERFHFRAPAGAHLMKWSD